MKRRSAATSPDCSSPLFKRYKRDWLPEQGEALGVIRGWIESGDRVVLICYEHLPEHVIATAWLRPSSLSWERRPLNLPRFRGQHDYVAASTVVERNSNSIGLT